MNVEHNVLSDGFSISCSQTLSLPQFSIIVPMFNAEGTIARAIGSVMAQHSHSWELIIVDDCSTDRSVEICQTIISENKVRNIRLIQLPQNSGNAKKPWDTGVLNAKGKYCLKLDSDDTIAGDYLEIMSKHIDGGADVVIPIMTMVAHNAENILGRIPCITFNMHQSFSGKEACQLTIPEWQIGCGGMAFKRSLYEYVLTYNDFYFMNSDEFSERIILYYAENVAISDAKYYYYQHPESITHKPSTKLCEMLFVDVQIINFVKERYDADLLKRTKQKLISRLIVLQKKYIKNKKYFSKSEWAAISDIIRKNYNEADWECANMSTIKAFLYSGGYPLFALICYCNAGIDKIKKLCFSR